MLKVGINGFGRIGRAVFRSNLNRKAFEVVSINDINPDLGNIAYQLNYDTLYDQLVEKFSFENNYIYNDHNHIKVFHERNIDDVNWKSCDVDIVIDSSGVLENVLRARKPLKSMG